MSQRFICRILLLFALAAVVYSQGTSGGAAKPEDKANPVAQEVKTPASTKQRKTYGIVGNLLRALSPLTDLFLQLFESYLKNMYGKSLPCRLESITPLKGECTKLKQK